MRLLQSGATKSFEYEWSDEYKTLQDQFNACVATFDPNNLMMLLQRHPFHVDSMLQLSEYFRATGQVETAAELLRRCLHTLEAGWHPSFKPWEYPCRLSYDVPANR